MSLSLYKPAKALHIWTRIVCHRQFDEAVKAQHNIKGKAIPIELPDSLRLKR